MKTLCIYHKADLDGMTCAAIIDYWAFSNDIEIEFIGWDYGDPTPNFEEYQKVIVCDICLDTVSMYWLALHLKENFIWIDHHKSSIDNIQSNFHKAKLVYGGVQEIGLAACELTWRFFFPQISMPWFIETLGKYDTWRQDEYWDTITLPFQFGVRSFVQGFKDLLPMFDGDVTDNQGIINIGLCILQYQASFNKKQCSNAFEHIIAGYNAICLNIGGVNSDVFKSVYNEKRHDLMFAFQYSGCGTWKCSFYTTKDIDCSKIAAMFGGGGHEKAAGCEISHEDFLTIINL
jgi:oligoribonuclease NrnB/cAMP/cGMP phosphodiesterase (DHH superfamily)